MAAPTFQAKGTAANGTGSSIAPSYPASVNAYDILIMKVISYGIGTITPHASWSTFKTVYIPFVPASPTFVVQTFWKVANGTETGSETVSRSGHTGSGLFMAQMYHWRGTSFLSIEDAQTTGGVVSTITWPALTINGSERTLAAMVVNYSGSNPGVPTGYSSDASDNASGTYFELNTKSNVSSDGSVTDSSGSANGWATIHISFYNNTPASVSNRSFIVN